MPCPLSIPDCLLVEQLSEQSARGAKIPRSHSSWSHFFPPLHSQTLSPLS